MQLRPKSRWARWLITTALVMFILTALTAAWGAVRRQHVGTYTITTTAAPECVWALWANVANRQAWDTGLEYVTIDGEFKTGARGEVKVSGQSARRYTVLDAAPYTAYTDRFHLPLGTSMNWHHQITEQAEDQRRSTYTVTTQGPTAVPLSLVMRQILNSEMPQVLRNLARLAENENCPAGSP